MLSQVPVYVRSGAILAKKMRQTRGDLPKLPWPHVCCTCLEAGGGGEVLWPWLLTHTPLSFMEMNQPKVQSSRFRFFSKRQIVASDLGNLKLEALFISMTGQVMISSGGTNVRVCETVIVEGFSQINRSESSKARQVHLRQTFLRWWRAYRRAGLSVVVRSSEHELFLTFFVNFVAWFWEHHGVLHMHSNLLGSSNGGQNKSSTQLVQPVVSCAWFAADLAESWVHCTQQFFVIARFNL